MNCVGFYNQLGIYPSSVIPIYGHDGKRFAVFISETSEAELHQLADDVEIESVSPAMPVSFSERLFAFSPARIVKYRIDRESFFFRAILLSDALGDNIFLRLSLAEAVSDRLCSLSELIQCTDEWLQQDKRVAKKWFYRERLRISRNKSMISSQASSLSSFAEMLLFDVTELTEYSCPTWMKPAIAKHGCVFTDEDFFKSVWSTLRALGHGEDIIQDIFLELWGNAGWHVNVTEAAIFDLLHQKMRAKEKFGEKFVLFPHDDPVFELPSIHFFGRDADKLSLEEMAVKSDESYESSATDLSFYTPPL